MRMKGLIAALAIAFLLLAPLGFAVAKSGDDRGGGHAFGREGNNAGGNDRGHHYGLDRGEPGVPEIDPGMAAGAIAFLSCGAAILGSRKKT